MVSRCGERVMKYSGQKDDDTKTIISNLLYLLKNDSLSTIIRQKEVSEVFLTTANLIEKATLNGPLHMIGGTLLIQAQSILGFTHYLKTGRDDKNLYDIK